MVLPHCYSKIRGTDRAKSKAKLKKLRGIEHEKAGTFFEHTESLFSSDTHQRMKGWIMMER